MAVKINFMVFICIWLTVLPHPRPLSSPGYSDKPEFLLAGEGSIGERGRSPLSIFLPLSNVFICGARSILLIGEGSVGERLVGVKSKLIPEQPNSNRPMQM